VPPPTASQVPPSASASASRRHHGTARPGGGPSSPGRGEGTPTRNGHAPDGGTRPGGGRPDPTGGPPPASVVLGSPSPARYCAERDRKPDFRSTQWYCVPDGGIGVDTYITMAQVCAEQYPGSKARLNGDAGSPGDWDCYVVR
ncbi:hypothetical protein ACFQKB_37225, partial [Actinomadura yumaensis]